MEKRSAGLLMYRYNSNNELEVFLVHPGGPFWAKKDEGAWSVPKGEYKENEKPLDAARREFAEETGSQIVAFLADKDFISLSAVKQTGGKIITAWAFQGEFNSENIKSNIFEMEWPPKSGKMVEFPEADRAGWFNLEKAKKKISKGQIGFLEELVKILS